MATFGERLRKALDERGPLCAGIDPHAALLAQWGLNDDITGLERFALTAAEAFGPVAAAIKPQSAFFERHGSRGIAILERTIEVCRQAGAQVILDVKRGDIGSTAQGYADAYLDQSAPLAVDAITASPYLGFGSLLPMIQTALRNDAGVFVLALTSNPEAADLQRSTMPSGESVAGSILAELAVLNGTSAMGSLGAVVGATIEKPDTSLVIGGPLLVPGIGAQGGTADDVRRIFEGALDLVVPSSSRELLGVGPSISALADAVERAATEFREVVGS
ncbi:MAG TPA: orotidine-5'-phosphate decarboxylase [Marmoricola sp.]|nr:orotidine-5'-phosphate decarboxylase [Marmoricola sp.]